MSKRTDAQKFQLATKYLDIKADIPKTTIEATLRQGVIEDALATDEVFKSHVKQIKLMKWYTEAQQIAIL